MSLQARPHTTRLAATRFTSALERGVFDYIRKHAIFTAGEGAVIGVSGGPDSTALLVILSRLRSKLEIHLTAAHFDHMLRTRREAEDDASFVKAVAAALDVPLVTGAADVRANARRNHHSLEDAARRLRYAFLGDQSLSFPASCVSVGHTLDDQAETVLLHLIRGAGIDGLAGMRPRANWPFGSGPDIARPLLGIRRRDTERYCVELGIEVRRDPTNDVPIATRNRLRHELMPVLRRFNPHAEEAIARLADVAAGEGAYLDELATSYLPDVAAIESGAVSIGRKELLEAHPAMARRLIRLAAGLAHGGTAEVDAAHVGALLDALEGSPGNYSLPAGLTARTDDRSLTIYTGPAPAAEEIPETKLSLPGTTAAGRWNVSAQISAVPPRLREVTPTEAFLDVGKAGTQLTVRSRRSGDRLRPLGLGGEKKLQDILVDAKIPAGQRDGVPIVCAADQIAWVVGHCIDERYALGPESQEALHVFATIRDSRSETDA